VGEPNNKAAAKIRPCVRLIMPSIPKYLGVVRAALRCLAAQEGFAEQEIDQLVLATDEALSNVIKHGYELRPDGSITVILRRTAGRKRSGLEIIILDRGKTVDPTEISARNLDELRPGGLGVHIIRTVMDRVQYRRRSGGGMVLKMVKYAKAPPSENGTTGP